MPLEHVTIHGHRVGFRRAGSGPVVLLVHGMAGSSATWRQVMPVLAERFTVIAPDLLGHGGSAKPRGDYSLGGYASGLRDLLVALGHEKATLVGQSLGGGIVLQMAYQFPERCERLVLVGSGGLGDEVMPLLRLLTLPGSEWVLPVAASPRLRDAGNAVGRLLGRVGVRPAPLTEELWRAYSSLSDAESRTAFVHTLRSVVDVSGQRVSARDRLYLAADVPSLVMWGDADRVIPVDHAHATHAAIPGSRLQIFEGVGHFPHCEVPDRFVEVLVDFIESTDPADTSGDRMRELLVGSPA